MGLKTGDIEGQTEVRADWNFTYTRGPRASRIENVLVTGPLRVLPGEL